jgi:hypothetical protein
LKLFILVFKFLNNYFFKILNQFTMKSCISLLLICGLSTALWAQNDPITHFPANKNNSTDDWWYGVHFNIGASGTNTEGSLKKFITPPVAIHVALETGVTDILGLSITIRPTSLRQTFTNDAHVWSKDTSISFVTYQGSYSHQFWRSKNTALYVFGALGVQVMSPTGGSDRQNKGNRSCDSNNDKAWTLSSVAPSAGFFIDFRQKSATPNANPYDSPYSFWRVKFAANPAWFREIGSGVFYDAGLSYSF